MERQVWLAERRAAVVAGYDAEAGTYGDGEYPWEMQREWVGRVLGLIPPPPAACPCGTSPAVTASNPISGPAVRAPKPRHGRRIGLDSP